MDDANDARPERPVQRLVGPTPEELASLIEEQCDNMACGTQVRGFLRDDEGNEPLLREMLRLNLEQFARRLRPMLSSGQHRADDDAPLRWRRPSQNWRNRMPTQTEILAALDRAIAANQFYATAAR